MRDADAGARSRLEHGERADELVRHEEEPVIGATTVEAGAVRVRKHVEQDRLEETVPRQVEHVDDLERVPAEQHDSGEVETLPDGSVSIPVLEEELVITKRIVVRERVIVRKRTETERRAVRAELRKERVEVETDDPHVEIDKEEG